MQSLLTAASSQQNAHWTRLRPLSLASGLELGVLELGMLVMVLVRMLVGML